MGRRRERKNATALVGVQAEDRSDQVRWGGKHLGVIRVGGLTLFGAKQLKIFELIDQKRAMWALKGSAVVKRKLS